MLNAIFGDLDFTEIGWYRKRDTQLRIAEIIMSMITNPSSELAELKRIYDKFDEGAVYELGEMVDDAWERVVSSAKEDMFDTLEADREYDEEEDEYIGEVEYNGNEYSSSDDIGDEEMFDYYYEREGLGLFIQWMREEFAHNVESKKLFRKYIGSTNDINWDRIARSGRPDFREIGIKLLLLNLKVAKGLIKKNQTYDIKWNILKPNHPIYPERILAELVWEKYWMRDKVITIANMLANPKKRSQAMLRFRKDFGSYM